MLESKVAYYSTLFPGTFKSAEGCYITTTDGRRYLDFFAGAGALNYGHNHPQLMNPVVEYINNGGILHSLDMKTVAKETFMKVFPTILDEHDRSRFKIMFTGPTGTNAVEAALKLARKYTERQFIMAHTGGYHGMTLGALAATTSMKSRRGAGIPLEYVHFVNPCQHDNVDSYISELQKQLEHYQKLGQLPAAFLFETVLAEGGVYVLPDSFLDKVGMVLQEYGILVVVDDIQAGCGRTGTFLSYQCTSLRPDIVCLSKSLSGIGTPFSAILIDEKIDCWSVGEHNGTFRGNNLAFVAGAAAIDIWKTQNMEVQVKQKSILVENFCQSVMSKFPKEVSNVRGKGLIWGIEFVNAALVNDLIRLCYKNGLIIESCGPNGEVLKLLPPLLIADKDLQIGLQTIFDSILELSHVR